jgi:nucleotide-binding universal stress UspA family protein
VKFKKDLGGVMTRTVENGRRGRIVVGVDGSASSTEALRWAARQAELTVARVEAVMAWAVAPTAFPLTTPIPAAYDMGPQVEEELEGIVSQVRHEFPSVEILSVVREGWAGRALLVAAEDADLLVVGSRGHGAVMGLLLGSVSEYCVTHAPCPVVVIRHGRNAVVVEDGLVGSSSAGLMRGTWKDTTR